MKAEMAMIGERNECKMMLTIVLLCHNQCQYLQACANALQAEIDAYEAKSGLAVEVLLIDDASTDGSRAVLARIGNERGWEVMQLEKNVGNCKAFNIGLERARGKYVIDLAADDLIASGRMEAQIGLLEADMDMSFCYGDATYIDTNGQQIYRHSDRYGKGANKSMPKGWLFERLFRGHFICPSTVVMRTEVLKKMGGYDEELVFEDFDIWMRLARVGKVGYADGVTSFHRVADGSLSGRLMEGDGQAMLWSICRIGEKAIGLSESVQEREAIAWWLGYHVRLAVYLQNGMMARRLLALRGQLRPEEWWWVWLLPFAGAWWPTRYFYHKYQKMRAVLTR